LHLPRAQREKSSTAPESGPDNHEAISVPHHCEVPEIEGKGAQQPIRVHDFDIRSGRSDLLQLS
jgi:hypothetical protein